MSRLRIAKTCWIDGKFYQRCSQCWVWYRFPQGFGCMSRGYYRVGYCLDCCK